MATLNPAQIAEIQAAYKAQSAQAAPQLTPDQVAEIKAAYQAQVNPTVMQQLKAGTEAIINPNAQMPMATQNALNQLSSPIPGVSPAGVANADLNFVRGAVHPLSSQNSGAGMLGQMTALAPLADVGGLLRAGRALPMVGQYAAKAGEFLDPMLAQTKLGMTGRAGLNAGLGGGILGALTNPSNSLMGAATGALTGGVAGSALGALASVANNGKLDAVNQLKGSQTVQDFIGNLTGNVKPNEIAAKTGTALNELKNNVQKLSTNSYRSLMQRGDQVGIDASEPLNTWAVGNKLEQDAKDFVDPKYKQLSYDIQRAKNLFATAPNMIDTGILDASGQPILKEGLQTIPSLQALNNFKTYIGRMIDDAPDNTASSFYKQIFSAAKQDIQDKLANTPLASELKSLDQYFQDHVLPLRNLPQGMDAQSIQNHILNGENSNFTKALLPEAGNMPIQQAHNAMLQQFMRSNGTSPDNLVKGFLISSVDNNRNIIDPDKTIKSYYNLATAAGKSSNSKIYSHLFNGDALGNPPLFTSNDRIQMGQLANKAGFFGRNLNVGDAAYEAAAIAGHSNPSAWVAKNATNILTKYLPQADKYFEHPAVKQAFLNGGIPAAEKVIRGLMNMTGPARIAPAITTPVINNMPP